MPENKFIGYVLIALGIFMIAVNKNQAFLTAKWNIFINKLFNLKRSRGTDNVSALRIVYIGGGILFIILGWMSLKR